MESLKACGYGPAKAQPRDEKSGPESNILIMMSQYAAGVARMEISLHTLSEEVKGLHLKLHEVKQASSDEVKGLHLKLHEMKQASSEEVKALHVQIHEVKRARSRFAIMMFALLFLALCCAVVEFFLIRNHSLINTMLICVEPNPDRVFVVAQFVSSLSQAMVMQVNGLYGYAVGNSTSES